MRGDIAGAPEKSSSHSFKRRHLAFKVSGLIRYIKGTLCNRCFMQLMRFILSFYFRSMIMELGVSGFV